MLLKTNKKNKNIEINSLKECEDIIIKSNVIKNLKLFNNNIEKKIIEVIKNNDEITRTLFFKLIRNIFSYDNSSCFQVKYWINRGYTQEDSKIKISKIQKSNFNKGIEKISKEKNITLQEATNEFSKNISNRNKKIYKKIPLWLLKERSPRCVEYWIKKGHTEKEAENEVYRIHDNSSFTYHIEKYGDIEGEKKYLCKCKKSSLPGEKNGMFGKPSPIGSGNGISGYYNHYYFRSLLEYSAIKYFEENNIKFQCNDISKKKFNNKVIIKMDNGRNYIPDFLLPLEKTIVEIKAKYKLKSDDTIKKEKSALEYIKSSIDYLRYKILTEDDIDYKFQELKSDYKKGVIRIDRSKKERFKKLIRKIK